MKPPWEEALERWSDASLIEPAQADRIREWESSRQPAGRSMWPQILGMTFGGILLTAGVALLIGAQWDRFTAAQQTALTVALVSVFHLAAGAVAKKSQTLATILHGAGTVALGAGILLIAEIYQLAGHWSGAMLVWAVGSLAGWLLLRDWVQMALFAIAAPAWFVSVWDRVVPSFRNWPAGAIVGSAVYLLALVYLASKGPGQAPAGRRALAWIGGIALIPAAFVLAVSGRNSGPWLGAEYQVAGWTVALAGPLALGVLMRRDDPAPLAGAVGGTLLIAFCAAAEHSALPFVACAVNAIGVAAWGLRDRRPERINLGIAGFAIAVLAFFFSDVLDKLGRAAGLMAAGALFLAGGWYLERFRRKLVAAVKRSDS